ncbi:hypothetical protein EJ110_NYTH21631 [Nymphaea thermarum]|nr:hypothetical protein EJ110_NYTH21631 [Nymphaea thermarum]
MTKECFTTNDLTFRNRLRYSAARYLAVDGYMLPVALYGDHWHEMRKIVVEEMLSNQRIDPLAKL